MPYTGAQTTRALLPWGTVGGSDPTGTTTQYRQGEDGLVQNLALPVGSQRRPLQPCGTPAAAQQHQRRGEPLCEPCREARRIYNRNYARLARQTKAFRERQAAAGKRWERANRERRNRYQRERAAQARLRELHDRRHEIDRVVVDRLIRGEGTSCNRAERREAVRLLSLSGKTYKQIAQLLQTNKRQVHRDLSDLGLINSVEAVA